MPTSKTIGNYNPTVGITTHSNGPPHGPSGHLLDAGFRKDHTVIVQGQIQEMLEEILRDLR